MTNMLPVPLFASFLLALLLPGLAGAGSLDRGVDGRFDQRRSMHFKLLQDVDIDHVTGPQGTRAFERAVLAELEEAHERVRRSFDIRPRANVNVVIYDPEIFEQNFAGNFRFSAVGFYDVQSRMIHVRGDTRVERALIRTLHHEYFHAALDAVSPHGRIPAWLNEGLAQWLGAAAVGKRRLGPVEYGALVKLEAAGSWLPIERLSGPSFVGFGEHEAPFAYLESYAMVDFLMRANGEHGMRKFLRQLIRNGGIERQMKRVLRIDYPEFESLVRKEFR